MYRFVCHLFHSQRSNLRKQTLIFILWIYINDNYHSMFGNEYEVSDINSLFTWTVKIFRYIKINGKIYLAEYAHFLLDLIYNTELLIMNQVFIALQETTKEIR